MMRWADREEYDREVMGRRTAADVRAERRAILATVFCTLFALVAIAALAWIYEPLPLEPELGVVEVVSPSEAFYGERRDTSAVGRVCCRVSDR